jgi:hypothetical protein
MTDTRKDALTALRDKVRTGTAIEADFAEAWPNATQSEHSNAWLAYIGSIDAAKQLHDAVLPGWTRDVDATAPECGIDVTLWRPIPCGQYSQFRATKDCEARAWLLAILSALIAQAQP